MDVVGFTVFLSRLRLFLVSVRMVRDGMKWIFQPSHCQNTYRIVSILKVCCMAILLCLGLQSRSTSHQGKQEQADARNEK